MSKTCGSLLADVEQTKRVVARSDAQVVISPKTPSEAAGDSM